MPDRLAPLTEALLAAATKAGADASDAIAVDGTSVSVDVRAGVLEQAERSEGIEIGLRVLVGQRQACVSASDTSDRTIAEMAERAVAMAREAPEDPTLGLADPSELASAWDLVALDLSDRAPEPAAAALEDDARRAEAAALAVKGVSQCQSASASYSRRRIFLAATNGFAGGYGRTSRSTSAVAITGEGLKMERDWAAESRTYQSDLPSAEEIGLLAGDARRRTCRRAEAEDRRLSGAIRRTHCRRAHRSSPCRRSTAAPSPVARPGCATRWAQQVLPKGLSIFENPHRPRISGSRPFDAEGLATEARDDRRRRRADGLDAGPRHGAQARAGLHRLGHARHLVAALARRFPTSR